MKFNFFHIILAFLLGIQVFTAAQSEPLLTIKSIDNYLAKPTGQYGIGFEDFHWINQAICPDPNFNGKNTDDFTSENQNHCHETIARVYYPTCSAIQPSAFYYPPLVSDAQDELRHFLVVPKKQIDQLSQIKTYSEERKTIVVDKIFPVILFSPGLGIQSEMYENFIEELVSHGYIVIGISSPFINGDLALPNGHIVKYNHKYDDEKGTFDREIMQVMTSDFSLVFDQIHRLHETTSIFKAMDLQNIGALGHSIGGNVVANATHAHSNWFRAGATLDIGYDLSGESFKKFSIPFIHLISSTIKDRTPVPIFEMGEKGFIGGISPDEQNRTYSFHMNFTDQSTLQYLPAYQTLMWWIINILHKEVPVGKGNGWEITQSINTDLIEFFNTYIKNEPNPAFTDCKILSKNTFIKCGPGVY